ncbi:MAG: hypothetical protein ABIO44_05795 [Saprospiraceae bacterium]
MKSKIYSILLVGSILNFMVSCNSDSDDNNPPTSQVIMKAGYSIDKDNLKIGSSVKISIKAVKGSKQLNTITVKTDGVNLPAGSFIVNGVASSANPALLFGGDRDSLLFNFEFSRVDVPQTISYYFIIIDENNDTTSQNVSINYYGTPSEVAGTGLVVYNYSGPNFGGLDLFAAKVVSGNAPEATIRDFGVVDPVADKTWVMRFSPLNNSEIMNPSSNYTYGGLIYKENIQRAFELGSREPGKIVSKVLAKGDFFLVKNGTSYFAISIDKVVATANDNNDYFEVSIKK